jgi:hypothetical protein
MGLWRTVFTSLVMDSISRPPMRASRYLVHGRAELLLMNTLVGGNESDSSIPPLCPTTLRPSTSLNPQHPVNLPGSPSQISTGTAQHESRSPEQRSGLNAGSRIWRFRVRDPLGSDTPGGALVVWP